jgi:hypothetical protein
MKNENSPRRDFVKKSLALTTGLAFGGSILQSLTAEAETAFGDSPVAANEKEFRMGESVLRNYLW